MSEGQLVLIEVSDIRQCSVESCNEPVWSPNGRAQHCVKHRRAIRTAQQASYNDERRELGFCIKCGKNLNDTKYVNNCLTCRIKKTCRRYGISVEQRDALLASQSFRCGGCGILEWEYEFHTGRLLDIDHDHRCCPRPEKDKDHRSCGSCVRALYCKECNLRRGKWLDDPVIIERVADVMEMRIADGAYLRSWRDHPAIVRQLAKSVRATNWLMDFRRAGGRDWFLLMAGEINA